MNGNVLVTGAAGFIGSHVAARLAELGHDVVGCDNFNAYYDPALKEQRVAHLLTPRGVTCQRVELADGAAVCGLFEATRPRLVIHLAAQAQPQIALRLAGVELGAGTALDDRCQV